MGVAHRGAMPQRRPGCFHQLHLLTALGRRTTGCAADLCALGLFRKATSSATRKSGSRSMDRQLVLILHFLVLPSIWSIDLAYVGLASL